MSSWEWFHWHSPIQTWSFDIIGFCFSWWTGTIPTELGDLTALTELWLYNNKFTGIVPSELGKMKDLTRLYLYGNHFSGSIPTELGQLVGLTNLELNYNSLSGSLPTELGKLTSLTKLFVFDNQLTGSIPTELGQLVELIYLNLNGPKVSQLSLYSWWHWLALWPTQINLQVLCHLSWEIWTGWSIFGLLCEQYMLHHLVSSVTRLHEIFNWEVQYNLYISSCKK